MKYGLPYKGSKNRLAERIVRLLPNADHLIDLFCGGCAVAHAALVMGKYQHVHINDVNWMCPTLFVDALNGKYADDTRWISRDDFQRLKDTDPYVAFVWSFGNNLRDYLYSREIEPLKKSIHYAIFFGDYSLAKDLGHDLSFIEPINDLQKRYLAIKHYFEGKDERMQSFEGGAESRNAAGILQPDPTTPSTATSSIGGAKRLRSFGDHGKTYKHPSELQHLEGFNRVSEFKKKKRIGTESSATESDSVAWHRLQYRERQLALPRSGGGTIR